MHILIASLGYLTDSSLAYDLKFLIQWTFHPFVFHSKRFYTVIVWYRTLVVLVVRLPSLIYSALFLIESIATPSSSGYLMSAGLQVCQFLRVITFLSTQLPGPNYHCREV